MTTPVTSTSSAATQPSTATTAAVFDTRHVAYVFNQRGYRVNEFAARLDMSNNIIEAFLRGTGEPGELRVATLVNMANHLGIPLHTMFIRPAPTPDPETLEGSDPPDAHGEPDTVTADAEQLIATIYDTGRTTATLAGEIAKAFNWTTDRVYTAATEATRRLQPAGLKVTTSHGELFIQPVNQHLEAQKALAQRKVYERGLSYIHYKALHQIINNNPVTVTASGRQRLRTLGGLVNIGVVTDARRPALTDAATEAFLFDSATPAIKEITDAHR